jgi:hypothetical protein
VIHPAPVSRSERRAAATATRPVPAWRDVEARPLAGAYPPAAVSLGGTARLRGRDLVALRFQPLQYMPDGTARFTATARVRLVFADRPARRAVAPPADPLQSVLPNATTASAWALPAAEAAAPKPPRGAGTTLPAERLRIRIGQRGLHELTFADLRSAGVPVEQPSFEPRSLRVLFDRWQPGPFYADSIPAGWQPNDALQETAIWVPGEGNGFSSNDPDDRVVFYALGPQGWEDLAGASADSLAWFRHPYDRDQYAWLVWGGDFGRRVADVSAAPQVGDSIVTHTWQRVHLEEDNDFDAVDDLWYWEEVGRNRPFSDRIDLDLGGEPAAAGSARLKFGYGATGPQHGVDIRWNGVTLGRAQFIQANGLGRWFGFENVTLQAQNTLDLTVAAGFAPATQFLEADVAWARPLVATPTRPTLEWSARPTRAGDVYEIRGLGAAAPIVWDVTDAQSPRRLVDIAAQGGGAGTAWRLRGGRGAGVRAHYLATSSPIRPPARDLVRRMVAPLRARTTAPDMVVLTHATVRSAAERLVQHRRTHWRAGGTSDIAIVDVADVYDNFSGGRVDPLAVRNYLKFLYRLDPTPRLLYVLFFGDATHDPRVLRSASGPTLVPAIQPGVVGHEREGIASHSAVDDWLVEMDTPAAGGSSPYPVPDLAHGRITARTLPEADRIVDKLIAYETTAGYGVWRNRIVMVADDECHPINGCIETYHIDNTEALARRVPPELDVVKLYLTEYPRVLGQKPLARTAFTRLWSEGCAVINYQGHGAPRQIADEVLFLSVDVPSLTNGARAPLFLPISCTVSEFDDPDRQSMCEDLLASTAGGAIATIGATKDTYVTPNYIYNSELFTALFAGGSTSQIPIGLAELRAKVRATSGLNESYVLLGDPAMPLLLPPYKLQFTAGVDSLVGGGRARVEAAVVAADSAATVLTQFDGQAEVEVFGTADESGYRSTEAPFVGLRYDLPGPPLYRGSVPVVDGRLAFDFIVPFGARAGTKGRVSAYAFGAAGDAKGADPAVRVALSDSVAEPSLAAPRIVLRFPNDRTRVKAGTILTAEISDENGINIQGTTPRNSIYLDFDARNEPLNVTAQFRYVAGSATAGAVAVPLPADLEPGSHSATVIASDNLLNTESATLEFEVVDPAVVQLVNVLAFPNPFRDWTHFFFEVTDPGEIEIAVFTTSGREVWRQRRHVLAGTHGSIKWDGVDSREDELANGTYLYRLRARPDRAGAPTLERIGKVVIMR